MTDRVGEISRLLVELQSGDSAARERLLSVAYEELRILAQGLMRRERQDHLLQPTALVHEAALRVFDRDVQQPIPNRSYLFAMMAHAMRRILVEHARQRDAARRGGSWERVPLDDVVESVEKTHGILLLDLEDSLHSLKELHPRSSEVVTLRFFGGLEFQDIAEHLGVSLSTVERDWRFARAWLRQRLSK